MAKKRQMPPRDVSYRAGAGATPLTKDDGNRAHPPTNPLMRAAQAIPSREWLSAPLMNRDNRRNCLLVGGDALDAP